MPSFVPDTSCIVAVVLQEHPHHERAMVALDDLLDRGYHMLVVGHTLLEAYATLTNMPRPLRIRPADAVTAIDAAFVTLGTVVSLEPDEYVAALHGFVQAGVLGGQVYDASIVACARARGAEVLLTLNERHFRRFEGDGLTVVVP
jgi:predicted nucleic acid-binding protein